MTIFSRFFHYIATLFEGNPAMTDAAETATDTVTSDTASAAAPRSLDQVQSDIAAAKAAKDDISARESALAAEKLANANLLSALIDEGRAAVELAKATSQELWDGAESDFKAVESDIGAWIAKQEAAGSSFVAEVEKKAEEVVQAVEFVATDDATKVTVSDLQPSPEPIVS